MRIAVIGVGPRGLSALERIVSHARLPGPPVELLLIEPGELGSGTHDPNHPDYVLLNTIAGQLTIFSDDRMTPDAPVTLGPTFFEWCRQRRPSVRFDEYLPRRMLGEYLRWAAGELVRGAPARLTVRHLPTIAVDVRPNEPGASVTTADGTKHQVDLAVVTTGHGLAEATPAEATPTGRLVRVPYPLPQAVEAIPSGATVALVGTGLTAMDVIAALTVGRGGRFTDGAYVASGREPHLVLTNRTGWLPCARPATRPDRVAAPARHLTPAALTALRRSTPDGRLDFRRDVEPLIRREVLGRMTSASAGEIEAVERVLNPTARSWPGHAEYVAEVLDRARLDLREAERGLGVSQVKEGLEVLRDHRESLRSAIDPPGLTDESHRYFMTEFAPLVNRTVIGPQKERIQELLILVEAGVVSLGPGPRPEMTRTGGGWELTATRLGRPHRVTVDVLVRANLNWPVSDPVTDPVTDSLRDWVVPGSGGEPCLGLDRDGFAVPRLRGTETPAVAVFGPPAEGASYYNHYVPSPAVWSRALTDLDRVIGPRINA
nr:FAD/NAD(P)-binding protein [Micromonospora sp. DSM 115978]